MNLTEHFTLEELTASDQAQRLEIPNVPPLDIERNLQTLANGLELIRTLLGAPLHINSGYRCPALNRAVNGAATSAHLYGYAVDFTCAAYGPPLVIVRAIQSSGIVFDQVIQEGTWVHVSFDPRQRRQVLTAHFGPNGTTYSGVV